MYNYICTHTNTHTNEHTQGSDRSVGEAICIEGGDSRIERHCRVMPHIAKLQPSIREHTCVYVCVCVREREMGGRERETPTPCGRKNVCVCVCVSATTVQRQALPCMRIHVCTTKSCRTCLQRHTLVAEGITHSYLKASYSIS
jgi:hypothetical protein